MVWGKMCFWNLGSKTDQILKRNLLYQLHNWLYYLKTVKRRLTRHIRRRRRWGDCCNKEIIYIKFSFFYQFRNKDKYFMTVLLEHGLNSFRTSCYCLIFTYNKTKVGKILKTRGSIPSQFRTPEKSLNFNHRPTHCQE